MTAQLFRTETHEANSLNVVTSRCDTQLYKRKESAVCHNTLRIISWNVLGYVFRLTYKTAIIRGNIIQVLHSSQFFVLVVLRLQTCIS